MKPCKKNRLGSAQPNPPASSFPAKQPSKAFQAKTAKMSSTKDLLALMEKMAHKMAKLEKKLKKSKSKHSSDSDSDSDHKAKKAKRAVSDGVKAWNAEVKAVLAEMQEDGWEHPDSGKPATYKDALAEASRRRTESSPEAKAKYEAYRARVEAKQKEKRKLKKLVADSDSDSDSEDEKPKKVKKEKKAKKVVVSDSDSEDEKPKKKEKKAKKADSDSEDEKPKKKVAVKKPVKPAPAPVAEESTSAEEWEYKGKTYFKTADGFCWRKKEDGSLGRFAGKYDPVADEIDTEVEEPEMEEA